MSLQHVPCALPGDCWHQQRLSGGEGFLWESILGQWRLLDLGRWSRLTWPEMCTRSFSLCRDSPRVLVAPAGVPTAEGCAVLCLGLLSAAAPAVPPLAQGIPGCCDNWFPHVAVERT